MLAFENSSKSPVRAYRSCTGQVWYVHWFPSCKVCFGPYSRAVQSWEVCQLEFDFIDCGRLLLAIENFSKWPVRPYRSCTGKVWYVHWFPSWEVCFGRNSRAVQSWEVCEVEFQFFQWMAYVSYGEFFKAPVRPYRKCTGQVWYVHWFPSWKVCLGANSRAVQSWEACELEFQFFNGNPMLDMENSSKSPVRTYRSCTRQVWHVHWFPSWKVCFGPNSRAIQSWEVFKLEFQFFQWKSYVSYGEFFKVPCAAVQELYRSSLVCTLVPILKGVFWFKQQSCTVLGWMWTGISIFWMEILC